VASYSGLPLAIFPPGRFFSLTRYYGFDCLALPSWSYLSLYLASPSSAVYNGINGRFQIGKMYAKEEDVSEKALLIKWYFILNGHDALSLYDPNPPGQMQTPDNMLCDTQTGNNMYNATIPPFTFTTMQEQQRQDRSQRQRPLVRR
jgi:hypothetical protein